MGNVTPAQTVFVLTAMEQNTWRATATIAGVTPPAFLATCAMTASARSAVGQLFVPSATGRGRKKMSNELTTIAHKDYVRPTQAEIIAGLQQLNALGFIDAQHVNLQQLGSHSREYLIALLKQLDPTDKVAERATLLRVLPSNALTQRLNNSVLVQLARKVGKL